MTHYNIIYSSTSIVPEAVYLSADEITDTIGKTKAFSRSRAWDFIYTFAQGRERVYSTSNGVNHIWVTPAAVEAIIEALKDKADPNFDKEIAPLARLCESLRGFKRMTCADIIGLIASSKI